MLTHVDVRVAGAADLTPNTVGFFTPYGADRVSLLRRRRHRRVVNKPSGSAGKSRERATGRRLARAIVPEPRDLGPYAGVPPGEMIDA